VSFKDIICLGVAYHHRIFLESCYLYRIYCIDEIMQFLLHGSLSDDPSF